MSGVSAIFEVETPEPQFSLDITERVREQVAKAGVARGLCQVMVLHSTAAVVVNETADPNIGRDVIGAFESVFPTRNDWLHDQIDDNAHAHVKASILGASELIPIVEGELVLGRWQAIWLFEFDGPRTRKVMVHVLGD